MNNSKTRSGRDTISDVPYPLRLLYEKRVNLGARIRHLMLLSYVTVMINPVPLTGQLTVYVVHRVSHSTTPIFQERSSPHTLQV